MILKQLKKYCENITTSTYIDYLELPMMYNITIPRYNYIITLTPHKKYEKIIESLLKKQVIKYKDDITITLHTLDTPHTYNLHIQTTDSKIDLETLTLQSIGNTLKIIESTTLNMP